MPKTSSRRNVETNSEAFNRSGFIPYNPKGLADHIRSKKFFEGVFDLAKTIIWQNNLTVPNRKTLRKIVRAACDSAMLFHRSGERCVFIFDICGHLEDFLQNALTCHSIVLNFPRPAL
jgi:hypothetical protein